MFFSHNPDKEVAAISLWSLRRTQAIRNNRPPLQDGGPAPTLSGRDPHLAARAGLPPPRRQNLGHRLPGTPRNPPSAHFFIDPAPSTTYTPCPGPLKPPKKEKAKNKERTEPLPPPVVTSTASAPPILHGGQQHHFPGICVRPSSLWRRYDVANRPHRVDETTLSTTFYIPITPSEISVLYDRS
jgi:hypothetical protein